MIHKGRKFVVKQVIVERPSGRCVKEHLLSQRVVDSHGHAAVHLALCQLGIDDFAAVLQAVAGGVRLGHCLRGKAQGRGGVGLRPGGALRQRQLWQRHPEQTEYNGEYAKPVEQADRQLAHKKHSLPR